MAAAEADMEARIARLEADVSHIRADLADVKVDVRALRGRLDETSDQHVTALAEIDRRLVDRMDAMNTSLTQRMDAMNATLTQRMDAMNAAMNERFEKVNAKIADLAGSLASAKVWALVLYITLAGAVYGTLARAMGWL